MDKTCHDMLKEIYEQNVKIIKESQRRERQWIYGFVILGLFVILGFFV